MVVDAAATPMLASNIGSAKTGPTGPLAPALSGVAGAAMAAPLLANRGHTH